MRESQPGISSIAGLIASPAFAAYNISRAGVWMLTKSIALHCAREGWDICCNSIHPTFVRTPMLDSLGGDRSREEAEGTLCPPDPDRAPRRTPRRRVCCCLPRFRREPNDGHFRTKAEWQHFRDVMQAVACTARVECAHRGDLTPYRRNCTDAP
jgi:NAD(P)-dependent dehydrogenase (short-subunit alcohol dehydrogenase family)